MRPLPCHFPKYTFRQGQFQFCLIIDASASSSSPTTTTTTTEEDEVQDQQQETWNILLEAYGKSLAPFLGDSLLPIHIGLIKGNAIARKAAIWTGV